MDLPDTCNPLNNITYQTYKIYNIFIPVLLMMLVLEIAFVFMAIPTSIGTIIATAGSFSTSKVPIPPST
jgi:hypothetical protein